MHQTRTRDAENDDKMYSDKCAMCASLIYCRCVQRRLYATTHILCFVSSILLYGFFFWCALVWRRELWAMRLVCGTANSQLNIRKMNKIKRNEFFSFERSRRRRRNAVATAAVAVAALVTSMHSVCAGAYNAHKFRGIFFSSYTYGSYAYTRIPTSRVSTPINILKFIHSKKLLLNDDLNLFFVLIRESIRRHTVITCY